MTKKQNELYELAFSKMAIPTCECILDEPHSNKLIFKDKDKRHDFTRKARRRDVLAKT